MATLLDLFKTQKKEIYGKSETIRIDSRGLINPPRAAALLLSSPTEIGDLIGQNAAGVLKGSANRPSDTIFNNRTFISKPKSLTAPTTAQLRDMIEPGQKYFVKKSLQPNIVGGFLQGASNLKGAAASQLIGAVNKFGSAKNLKKLFNKSDSNSDAPPNPQQYGTKFMPQTKFGKEKDYITLSDGKMFSKYIRNAKGELEERKADGKMQPFNFTDTPVDKGMAGTLFDSKITDIAKKEEEWKKKGHVYVLFKKEGDNFHVPFAGTVSGISEEITPEWTNFRYLGSPFKVHRYTGVERAIRFELKLYYNTEEQKVEMIKKLNFLKSLTFPYEKISQITYSTAATDKGAKSQYAFAPNFVYLTIGDLYRDVYGFIETLSVSIEENTSWPSMTGFGEVSDTMYPSVINVSVGMKIIETHETNGQGSNITYKYNFDGLNKDEKYTIK